MKPGKLYGVGIGPGDPRYLTLRAADVLRSVDVIFTVISQNASSSVSRSVVESLEPRGEIHLQIFSMSREKAVRAAQVQANADAIYGTESGPGLCLRHARRRHDLQHFRLCAGNHT